jgi:hypothetical protein
MALIKTINEVKAVLPKLVSNLSDASLLPNFDAAEIKYLVPIIGMNQYNDIVAKYSADPQTLSAEEQKLLKHLQLLVTVNAFRDDMIINHVMWSDQGLRTITTQEMGKPVGWEFKELKNFFVNRASDAEEILLTYLWTNKASYALWTASDEYKQFTSLLIRTGTDFSAQFKLYQPMRTYYSLQSIVAEVQELYLQSAIGEDLLIYLRDKNAPSSDETTAIKLLKRSLALLSIKESYLKLSVRMSDAGFTTVGLSRTGDPEDSEVAGRGRSNRPNDGATKKSA